MLREDATHALFIISLAVIILDEETFSHQSSGKHNHNTDLPLGGKIKTGNTEHGKSSII